MKKKNKQHSLTADVQKQEMEQAKIRGKLQQENELTMHKLGWAIQRQLKQRRLERAASDESTTTGISFAELKEKNPDGMYYLSLVSDMLHNFLATIIPWHRFLPRFVLQTSLNRFYKTHSNPRYAIDDPLFQQNLDMEKDHATIVKDLSEYFEYTGRGPWSDTEKMTKSMSLEDIEKMIERRENKPIMSEREIGTW